MSFHDGRIDKGSSASGAFGTVAVLGGGSWGTALASVAAQGSARVTLWCRREDVAADINTNKRNSAYLGDTPLPDALTATTDLSKALQDAEVVLLVTPSRTVRDISRTMAAHLRPDASIVLCAKGIEIGTGKLLAEVVAEETGNCTVGVLSGPTFAKETAEGNPTAVTIASPFEQFLPQESSLAARLALTMGTEAFRPYVSDDVVGVEVGGAMKNVIAIACGMMTGAGFAENTRAALITRGLDEMKTLAEALGGRRETVTGLSGIGDLTLTCSSTVSRNMSFGVQLGKGIPRGECFDGKPVVVEGEVNARSVIDLARRKGIDLPICETVHSILYDDVPIAEAFAQLWAAPLQAEPRALDLELEHPAGAEAARRLSEMIQ